MRRLRLPLIFIMMVFLLSVTYHLFYLDDLKTIFSMDSPLTLSSLIISASFLFLRFLDILLLSPARKAGAIKTPRLFVDILNVILLTVVVLFLINKVFHQPITGILAASGALGVIIGLSMQRMLADLFTGVAINMDKTVQLQDWVEYNTPTGPVIGQVTEINWRTIKLLTFDNNLLVIPNGALATEPIKNLSTPSSMSMFTVDFIMDFEVPSSRVLTLLEAAVLSVNEVLEKPRPRVYIDSVTERGVLYKIRFWLDIDCVNIYKGKHLVYKSALQHIHQSGLSLSYSKHDVYHTKMPKRQLDRHRDFSPLLQRVPIFKMLNKKELELIYRGVSEVSAKKGQKIVNAGQAGSSMFVVVEGVLSVFVDKVTDGKIDRLKVNQLIPGDFFGEMSLLTGEPRSATIIGRTDVILYEIKKRSIMMVLKERPEVGRQLSRILADRVISNKHIKIKDKNDKGKLASTLFSRMKEFFFGI